MASTFTDIGTELMATGENAGTWGTKTNTNIQILEEAINGYVAQALTSGGTVTLTYTDGSTGDVARHAVIALTGALSGNAVVEVPANEKVWIIDNQSTNAYTVTVRVNGQTGVTWGASDKGTKILYANGTDVVDTSIGGVGAYDLNGEELILDADADTSITADTDDQIDIKVGGTDRVRITAAAVSPSSADGMTLGTAALEFSDLFLADSSVIKFGADQDTTLTHTDGTGLTLNSTNKLTFGDTATFINQSSDGVMTIAGEATIDLTASTAVLVSNDLKLDSDSAVLAFGADSEITVTHVADTGLTLKHTATADDKPVSLTLQTGETDIAANDVIGKIDFQAPDEGTGTDAILVAAGIEAVSEGDFSSSSNATKLSFKTGASEAAAEKMSLSSGGNLTISGDLTVSGDDITMGTNTAGNLLIADGTNFNSIAAGSLSEISTVAADDVFVAVDTSGGGLKKITRSTLVSGLATSSGISNIVEDTSPQLGGNLDMNGSDIVTTSNATIDLAPNGTGTVVVRGNTNSGAIVFNCESNSHGQTVIAQPHSAGVTNTLTLPAGSSSTLVSLVSTDTLTNKTLTSPVINTGTFGTSILPTSADGTSLGSASKEFSDLFLADSSTIQFGNDQDTTLTHTDGTGLTLNSTNKLCFNDASQFIQGASATVLDIAATDEIELTATLIDVVGNLAGSGTGTFGGILKTDDATEATSTTDGSLQTDGGLSVVKDVILGDDVTLLSDAAVLKFGADAEVTLTHVHNDGLLLNTDMQLQFRDSAINIRSDADGDLDINADDEIELNSTLIDINGNVEISGTATTTGVHTFTAVPVFPNNTVETADIQDNAITLAKMASGTDGNVISYDASGNPVAIATGTDGQVLTSTGAGSPPAFEDAAGGGVAGIATNSTSGTAQTINSDNSITFPLQPYVVCNQTDQNNVTGDNTAYTVLYSAGVDVTSDMNEGTGTFTAPQDGVYAIHFHFLADGGFGSGHTYHNLSVVTGNRTHSLSTGTTDIQDSNGRGEVYAAICDMDANDTATCVVQVYGDAKTVDLGTDGRLFIAKIH